MASSGDDRVTWANYNKQNRRPRMDKSSRAKIFLPFNALEGLYEILAEKEVEKEQRIELSDDEAQLLDKQLAELKNGDIVTVTYYTVSPADDSGCCAGRYHTESGVLTGISYELKTLRIRDTVIPIPDVCRIEKKPDG